MKMKINQDGAMEWRTDGVLHRKDGPAYIHESERLGDISVWYVRGVEHRVGGPALIWNRSCPIEQWVYCGKLYWEREE